MELNKEEREAFEEAVRKLCAGPQVDRYLIAIASMAPVLQSITHNIKIDLLRGETTSAETFTSAVLALKRAIATIEGDAAEALRIHDEGHEVTGRHDEIMHAQEESRGAVKQ